MEKNIVKVGGAILYNPAERQKIIDLIKKRLRYSQIILVLSAIGRNDYPYSTDGLDKSIPGPLTWQERNRLRSIGETFSVLKIASLFRKEGIGVNTCSYKELGIISLENNNFRFSKQFIESNLQKDNLCIVPGYIVSDENGEPVTLPREGSDFTACFLAKQFNLKHIYLIKEIEGVYDKNGKLYHNLNSEEFINIVDGFTSPVSLMAVNYCRKEKITIIILNNLDVEVARITSC